ncbi:MAG: HEAT repeat domain-containing protein [Anaerolineae bacterium]|nr:HEAT repeat domain-containing protein [Anaerolineae bacterium]
MNTIGNLSFEPPHTSVFPAIVALYTGNAGERDQAIRQLTHTNDPQIIKLLVSNLGDSNEQLAVLSAISLSRFGDAAVDALIDALNNPTVEVRQRCIWVLWNLGNQRAVEPLMTTLRYDPDDKVRRYAACGLGMLKNPRAINSLIYALADADERVRWDAAVALAKIGSRAVHSLIIASQYGAPLVRAGAINALAWIRDERVVDVVAAALRDKNVHVRTRAAFALGWIGDETAVEPLQWALRDCSEDVRMQAAAALGWLRDPKSVSALAPLLDDSVEWVAYTAVEALASLGTSKAVAVLQEKAEHPSRRIRDMIHASLLQLGVLPPRTRAKVSRPMDMGSLWLESKAMLPQRRCKLVIADNPL